MILKAAGVITGGGVGIKRAPLAGEGLIVSVIA